MSNAAVKQLARRWDGDGSELTPTPTAVRELLAAIEADELCTVPEPSHIPPVPPIRIHNPAPSQFSGYFYNGKEKWVIKPGHTGWDICWPNDFEQVVP